MISDYDIHLAILSDFCSMDNYVLEPEGRRAVFAVSRGFFMEMWSLIYNEMRTNSVILHFPYKVLHPNRKLKPLRRRSASVERRR